MRQPSINCRTTAGLRVVAIGALAALPASNLLAAEVDLPPVSVGAGVRSSFTYSDPDFGDEVSDFELNSARIYISGKVTENISLMFNTDYNAGGATPESVRVIDAVAQFSFSDEFNIWAGRFLPPSDRANLYGPYYANHWGVYRDGVQDGYPFETEGRNDGVMYWGQFGIAKVSAGAFDVQGLTKGSSDVLYAGRVQLDFWDPESGYYLNSTYYGEKDLLAVGIAAQTAAGDNAYSVDFLLEKKLANSGVVTIEAEYAKYDGLGGYPSPASGINGPIPYDSSDGYYLLGAYVFPQTIGIGKFQVLAKYGEATYDYGFAELDQTTTELNLTYLIKDFNARVTLFYIDSSFDPNIGADLEQMGVGLQVQI
ncbi:porin [Peristeroidobacter agariperforans]|uniref:porin n=1 Tax=Peristeroidobacter agariperforans TaxID=268404 RepID=UPI0013004DEC|nr:porin [Peristeroidobacter agariperforans]